MSIGWDTDDVNPDEVEKSTAMIDKEGKYHCEIMTVHKELETEDANGEPRTPSIRFDLQVLHSVKGQSPKGSRLYHRLYFSDKEFARDQALKLALRLGLMVKRNGKAIDPHTGTGRITPELFERAEGLQVVCEVKEEMYRDKKQYRVPFNEFFLVSDERVKAVPKDPDSLALVKGGVAKAAPAASRTKVADPLADL
jgi:hypothetical protein